jgi:hypothetical protein
MFQLDDKFLEDLGLNELPEEQRGAFLQHIYSELELRVGSKLADGLSDYQLQEFESIIDRKDDVILAWLQRHAPNYQEEETFAKIQQSLGIVDPNDAQLRSEYAATKWLEINRPDYRTVVSQTLEGLKQEIIANKSAILGGGEPAA